MPVKKHTPGPWQAHHDHGWLVVESDKGNLYVRVELGTAACKHMADALLIAAAPDLLEALQGLLDVTDFHELYGSRTEAARAAIAKATGDTQCQ